MIQEVSFVVSLVGQHKDMKNIDITITKSGFPPKSLEGSVDRIGREIGAGFVYQVGENRRRPEPDF